MKFQKTTQVINRIAIITIGVLTSAIMLFLTFESFFKTVDMNMNNSFLENVTYLGDNVLINILYLLVFIALFFLLKKVADKIPMWSVYTASALWTILLGVLWVYSVRSAPTHDSQIVTSAAYAIAKNGDYSQVTADYFYRFPFQLGYVFVNELLMYILPVKDGCFLSLEVVNILFLAGANLSMISIINDIFDNKNMAKLAGILLMFSLQPILFSTFLYGNIPGFAFALLAVMLMMRYYKTNKYAYLIASPIALGLSVSVKLNNMIVFVAVVIIAVILLIKRRKLTDIIYILLACIMVVGIKDLMIIQYQQRANVDYGDGIPMWSWMHMGFSEGSIENGWYNYYCTVAPFEENNRDSEKTAEISKQRIKERLDYFSHNPKYTLNFFYKKAVSQWNEPTYQSIWTNQVRGFYGESNALGKFVIGDGEKYVKSYMNAFQLIVFLGMLIYCVLATLQKDIKQMMIPLIFLGGFLYHLLFEAKSQYALTYFAMMVPCAAVGYYKSLDYFESKFLKKSPKSSGNKNKNKADKKTKAK